VIFAHMIISPLSSVVSVTPGGSDGISSLKFWLKKCVTHKAKSDRENMQKSFLGNPIRSAGACRTQPTLSPERRIHPAASYSIRPPVG